MGDLELFSDLELSEDEMEDILDDLDALPEEMLDTIMERLELTDPYAQATGVRLGGSLMSYFAAVLTRAGDRWSGDGGRSGRLRVDDDLADLLRDERGEVRLL